MQPENSAERVYADVDASPVKSFFVDMLTRDIGLKDAILDLLDNCVDGILRNKPERDSDKPYEGYCAEINFDGESFEIHDNCGGIPWGLHDYAFRMGRPAETPHEKGATVGVYGIGMKRAIFKMGRECLITTRNASDNYEVHISPEWTSSEGWKIPVQPAKTPMSEEGTSVLVMQLNRNVAGKFGPDKKSFSAELSATIAEHYAFIINKGFQVTVNDTPVQPRMPELRFDTSVGAKIKPFFFETELEGVSVFLAVGFTRPIPPASEVEDELEGAQYSAQNAGWTVVCNDRVVLYCDRTELTGWGEAGVPRFHNQFIAVSGVVEFWSDDPEKLPTTTTKRGIESNSLIYLRVKEKMRQGMRLFTDYTNQWKKRAGESKKHMNEARSVPYVEAKKLASELQYTSVHKKPLGGKQFKPRLPRPPRDEGRERRIAYKRDIDDIRLVSQYLFDDDTKSPDAVGERCFDDTLKEARG